MSILRQSLKSYISFSDYVGFRVKENEAIHKKDNGWVSSINIQMILGGRTPDLKK